MDGTEFEAERRRLARLLLDAAGAPDEPEDAEAYGEGYADGYEQGWVAALHAAARIVEAGGAAEDDDEEA